MGFEGTLGQAVASYGLLAVLVLMAAESCGLPVPSEAVMPLAGALAAAGRMDFAAAVLAGALGNLAGSLVAYWLARALGREFLLGPGHYVGLRRHHLELAERWFGKHGLQAAFFGRLLPVVRTYISFPAGLGKVPVARFGLVTFAGATPWCALLTGAGYELGNNYSRLTGPLQIAGVVGALGVAAVVGWWYWRGRRA